MPGISQYQTVFRVSKNAASNNAEARVNKRNRKQISCLSCRTRKAKCDRQVPCMQCSKRGDGDSCTYPCPPRAEHEGGPKASEAQLRLRKLEEMVHSLIKHKPESESSDGDDSLADPPADSSLHLLPSEASSSSRLKNNGSESNYLGATHWQAILQNIRDIQVVLHAEPEESEDVSTPHGPISPDIFVDTADPLTLADIYKFLPPRHVADKLLSTYFNSRHTQMPIIHTVKFAREYQSFWANPASASFLWISILFAIFNIGSQVYYLSTSDLHGLDDPTSADYLRISGKALVAEAALLYGAGKLCRQVDNDMEAWMIMGMITRLAIKMGYHRDPCHLKDVSPFEGEMRRRVFVVVEALDCLISFQAGLPPIVHEEDCDAGPPANLFDTDFDEDCRVLPPPRESTDPTPMLYCICKRQQVKLLRRVSRHALSFKTPSYAETMKLDSELHDAHANLPLCVQIKPLSSSFLESTQTVMIRLNIELLHLRSLCVLHRSYLSHERLNPAYTYSPKICSDSALQVLKYEAELHSATQPGGRFYNERWISSSTILYDFLLSAMIICLDLYESRHKIATASREEQEIQTRKYDMLRQSQVIWASRTGISRDARHASSVLAVMLSKVPRPNIPSTLPIQPQIFLGERGCPANRCIALKTSHTSSFPAESDIPTQCLPESASASEPISVDPLNAIFSESDPIDWELVDQFLFDRAGTTDVMIDWQLPDVFLNA
ncbi:hypothetical protein OIDMADRAFT_175917 [Oidiodendron maius Zn]|uniref:Zn(2)-C6 fungal-type domain-containing protein n=1 Tax=Oidiodendron maius (strain Zn) TaxID=913774 RepID=A0A0C3HRW1_OIDMZ|nr:hypothetical protein OIDMADRAFT_175917 [Oidiodendron maius Zn]